MAKTYKIAVIPGDGIGKEVTPWAQKALEKAAEGVADFEYENFDLGAERYLRDGAILPEDEEERIKANDAILLGAVGDPRIKAGILERGLLLKLRFDLDQYVNLRPAGGGHRGVHQHRIRCGACGALRLQARYEAQEARHPGAQEERARQRR